MSNKFYDFNDDATLISKFFFCSKSVEKKQINFRYFFNCIGFVSLYIFFFLSLCKLVMLWRIEELWLIKVFDCVKNMKQTLKGEVNLSAAFNWYLWSGIALLLWMNFHFDFRAEWRRMEDVLCQLFTICGNKAHLLLCVIFLSKRLVFCLWNFDDLLGQRPAIIFSQIIRWTQKECRWRFKGKGVVEAKTRVIMQSLNILTTPTLFFCFF